MEALKLKTDNLQSQADSLKQQDNALEQRSNDLEQQADTLENSLVNNNLLGSCIVQGETNDWFNDGLGVSVKGKIVFYDWIIPHWFIQQTKSRLSLEFLYLFFDVADKGWLKKNKLFLFSNNTELEID